MIELKDVSKRYGEAVAVGNLSLEIADGELMVLVGPSGCGKTTTLKMINRIIEPSDGTIVVNGVDVRKQDPVKLRRSIGYVIQQVGLFPHLTVADNIGTVPRLLGWDAKRTRERVGELLELVGLQPQDASKLPRQLSGGQQQRVGVARALAADPAVLLMDEPFGAVDPITRERLQREMQRLQEVLRKTIVFVTHDVEEAVLLGDRITVLNVGGKLEQIGTPAELLGSPANDFVADFMGRDRQLRKLAFLKVSDAPLKPLTGAADGFHRVPPDMDLRDALDGLLASGRESLVVRNGDHDLGVLGFDGILQASHAGEP